MAKTFLAYSGGKDSTASVILAHELGIPITEIVFCEVMYDNSRGISAENPEHIRFIYETAFPMFESWGFSVRVLRSDKDFLTQFHKTIERSSHPDRIGQKRGFPMASFGRCWVKRDLKTNVIDRFYRDNQNRDATTIVGICADEPIRLRSLYKNTGKRSLLAENGLTQNDARELCRSYGLLSPIYHLSNRGGCWFCPWVKPAEWNAVPAELREELIKLEELEGYAGSCWNPMRGKLRDL